MSDNKKRPYSRDLFSRDFDLTINSLDEDHGIGGGYLKGEVVIDGISVPFKGVAFGRFGGHNINIEFEQSEGEVKKILGLKTEELSDLRLAVQVRIVQGEMNLRDSDRHSHDHAI